MNNIKKAVKNVAAESAEIGYDPQAGTNWCHLPMEMRMRCIGAMEFKTRIYLGATCKTEKELVGLRKYRFDRVSIVLEDWGFRITAKISKKYRHHIEVISNDSDHQEKNMQCALAILKTCDIKSFNFVDYVYKDEDHQVLEEEEENERREEKEPSEAAKKFQEMKNGVMNELSQCTPFPFERITIDSEDVSAMKFLLENCENLERITLKDVDNPEFPLTDILNIPSVLNVKQLYFTICNAFEQLCDLIHKWIEIDVALGKTLQFATWNTQAVASMVSKFADRIIENIDNEEVRIRMKDESKQIFLKNIASNRYGTRMFPLNEDYILCKVISMDTPRSEYVSGVEWIDNLYEMQNPTQNPTGQRFRL